MAKTLPLDLVLCELLPRLPAKSVGRFMCVSKVWYSFLKRPEFATMHLTHVTRNKTICQKILVMFFDSFSKFRTFDCEGKADDPNHNTFPFRDAIVLSLLGSCNGLCLVTIYIRPVNESPMQHLVVWNPLTGNYRKIKSMYSPHNFLAFYHDECEKDYRILTIPYSEGKAFMYSLKSNSWWEVAGINGVYDCLSEQGLFFSGFIHWIALDQHDNSRIISFDTSTERFKVVSLPAVFDACDYCGLITHQEYVHVFVLRNDLMELWRMNENKKEVWEKTRISLPIKNFHFWFEIHVLCFTRCGKLLLMCDRDVGRGDEDFELVKYNLENHTIEEKFRQDSFDVITYHETLVSPN